MTSPITLTFSKKQLEEEKRVNRQRFPPSLIDMQPFKKEIRKLYLRIAESPSASALLQRAVTVQKETSKSKIFVQMVPKIKAPFGAQYNNGVISICETEKFNTKLSLFIFELGNGVHKKEFSKIEEDASKKVIKTKEEYAKLNEKVEFETAKLHHATVKACVERENWHPCIDRYADEFNGSWKTFEGFWETQLTTGHAKFHEDEFVKLYSSVV